MGVTLPQAKEHAFALEKFSPVLWLALIILSSQVIYTICSYFYSVLKVFLISPIILTENNMSGLTESPAGPGELVSGPVDASDP